MGETDRTVTSTPERKAPTGFIGPNCLDTRWQTPPILVERVARYFGGRIPHDVCAAPENTCGAVAFWTEADDALSRPWPGYWWCNPPYGRALTKGGWLRKIAAEGRRGIGIALLSCARWEQHPFQEMLSTANAACFIRKRVDFIRNGEPVSGNTYANVFVGFGVDIDRWVESFAEVGLCVELRALSVPPVHGIKMPRARRPRKKSCSDAS